MGHDLHNTFKPGEGCSQECRFALKKCVMAAGIKKGIIGKDDFVLEANNIFEVLLALLHGVKLRYAQIKIAGRKAGCSANMGNYNINVE